MASTKLEVVLADLLLIQHFSGNHEQFWDQIFYP